MPVVLASFLVSFLLVENPLRETSHVTSLGDPIESAGEAAAEAVPVIPTPLDAVDRQSTG